MFVLEKDYFLVIFVLILLFVAAQLFQCFLCLNVSQFTIFYFLTN